MSTLIRLDSTIQGKNRQFNVEYADYLLKQIATGPPPVDNFIVDLNQMIIPMDYQCKEKNITKILFEKYAKEKKNLIIFLLVDLIRSKGIFEDLQYFSKSFNSIMFEDDLTFEFHFFSHSKELPSFLPIYFWNPFLNIQRMKQS
jgi:hypothetical protein